MKKNRKYIIISLLILPLVTFSVDYGLATINKAPFFAFKTAMYKDGGTALYQGLGYKVIDYNELEGRQDVVFISKFINKGESN